jgi:hypothetical protein
VAEALCYPRPVQEHVRILVGGAGERRTLRLVARYADACNLFAASHAEVAHKLDVLRAHCDEAGRDYARIRKTMLYAGDALREGDTDAFVADMAGYAELGIETVIVMPPDAEPAAWIESRCAPAVPRLAGLG